MVMRLLAVSGSLRAQSTNTTLLRALSLVAPPQFEIVLYEEMDQIPPFNPDIESAGESGPVGRFRAAVRESDAVLFSTPEYAHGIPGSLKNTLDWIVGTGELSKKPVVLINASPRSLYAQAALKEVLKAMDARVLHDAEVTVDLQGKKLTSMEVAADPAIAAVLNSFLERLTAIRT
jgi:chromate reductase